MAGAIPDDYDLGELLDELIPRTRLRLHLAADRARARWHSALTALELEPESAALQAYVARCVSAFNIAALTLFEYERRHCMEVN